MNYSLKCFFIAKVVEVDISLLALACFHQANIKINVIEKLRLFDPSRGNSSLL